MARADSTDSSKICGIELRVVLTFIFMNTLLQPDPERVSARRVLRIDSHAVNPAVTWRVSDNSQQKEDVMSRISCTRWLVAIAAAMLLLAGHADASQGPGTMPGTASAFTQTAMAIVVYGLCAAAIIAGAVGTFRKS